MGEDPRQGRGSHARAGRSVASAARRARAGRSVAPVARRARGGRSVASVALRACLAAAWLAGAACGRPAPPDVLLITVDTLRADHLAPYSASAPPTPEIAALARESTVFERAAAPMGLTRPSHFSIFTSLYPREHGALNNATGLTESSLTLAEILREHGYRNGAFVGVELLAPASGIAQGFEVLDAPVGQRERRAVKVVRAALRWAGSVPPEDPYFLWVHLFDPHQPYNPPPEYRAGLDPEMAAAHPSLQWDDFTEIARRNGGDVPAAVLEHARALYRGEVSYADHWVGRLVEGLDALGRRKEPIVVLTADHGECFEKGVFFEHSDCLYEGTSHVPLIVRDPPDFAPGARVEEQVSLVDLAPTVLAAAGIPIPAHFSGRPLQRHAEAGDDRYVLLQHPFYQPRAALGRVAKQKVIRSVGGVPTAEILVGEERVGVVGRDWKLIRTEGEAGPSEGELDLYPMSPRPDESQDLAARRADVRDALEARLDALLEEHPLHIVAPAAINEELRETLEALGYLE